MSSPHATIPERVPGDAFARARPQPAGERHLAPVLEPESDAPLIGVLALQGDVLEHLNMVRACGARALPVKRADELAHLDGLILPGGESTTIGKLAVRYGLFEPLQARIDQGMPVFGTCAGAILLARRALNADGVESDQPLLARMNTVVRRNAFGRQVDSCEADLEIDGVPGGPVRAAFIRAPWIEQAGPQVDILATVTTAAGDRVVVARQGRLLVSAFHPELTGDARLHQHFVEMTRTSRRGMREGG